MTLRVVSFPDMRTLCNELHSIWGHLYLERHEAKSIWYGLRTFDAPSNGKTDTIFNWIGVYFAFLVLISSFLCGFKKYSCWQPSQRIEIVFTRCQLSLDQGGKSLVGNGVLYRDVINRNVVRAHFPSLATEFFPSERTSIQNKPAARAFYRLNRIDTCTTCYARNSQLIPFAF